MATLVTNTIFMALNNEKPEWKAAIPPVEKVDSQDVSICHENQCQICGIICSTKGNLKTHLDGVHNGKKYPCTYCQKKFPQDSGRIRHENSCHKG